MGRPSARQAPLMMSCLDDVWMMSLQGIDCEIAGRRDKVGPGANRFVGHHGEVAAGAVGATSHAAVPRRRSLGLGYCGTLGYSQSC
eukprot:6266780-Pyramimonas_sp.AAC.1